jgi:6-phosphogluconolactonase (cycloisomerase 2 family)
VQAVSLDPATGQLTLLEASTLGSNPAFIIKHPSKDVFYTSLEGIIENGEVVTFKVAKRGAIKVCAHDRLPAGPRL